MNFGFKNREQIDGLLSRADDNVETERLLRKFEELKGSRVPFFLTEGDFEDILRWKLRSQYGRQKEQRKKNTPEIVKAVTMAAFSIAHIDKDAEAFFRLRMLKTLVGVETAVASAILTLCYPNEYAVVDFRNWRQMFGDRKTSFTSTDYQKYMGAIRRLASQHGLTVQQADQAIWQYDIETGMNPAL
jgi:hypothetical protein